MALIICDKCGHDMSKHGRLDSSTRILMIEPCENCLMECDKEYEEYIDELETTIEKLEVKVQNNNEYEEERKNKYEEETKIMGEISKDLEAKIKEFERLRKIIEEFLI